MSLRPTPVALATDSPGRPPSRLSDAEDRELMSAVEQELRAEVSNRWRGYYPDRVPDGTPTFSFTPRRCGFSAIYRVDLDFPSPPRRESLIVKIRREQRDGSFRRLDLSDRIVGLVQTEYQEHVRASEYFANVPGLSVVRPVDFIESLNAIVVEFAAGADLSLLVRDTSPVARPAMARAGAWWQLFHHDLHQSELRPWSADAAVTMIDRRLSRLQAVGAPADTLDPLRDAIARTIQVVEPSDVPVSRIHGDCKLRHIWATPDQIQVLDFGNTSIGDAWLDPAALVVELSLYSLWTTRMDAASKVEDIRALLRAYFDGPPPPAFALYVVDALLKKWHRRLRSWGAGTGLSRLQETLRTARLDTVIDRLYIDRWFATQVRAWLALAERRPPSWLGTVTQ